MSKDYKIYINDILLCIDKIQKYVDSRNKDKFLEDQMAVDAVLRNLEIIGEAAKNINLEIKDSNPDIRWKQMAGLRDILIHAYSTVQMETIWNTIKNDLPILKIQMSKIK